MSSDNKDQEAHVNFMLALKDLVSRKIGDDKMVAVVGNMDNGIYCIMVSVHQMPDLLVISQSASMLINTLRDEIWTRFQNIAKIDPKTPVM